MSKFDFGDELKEVKKIKTSQGFVSWVKRKSAEVYANAQKYPKTAFAVGLILGYFVGKII